MLAYVLLALGVTKLGLSMCPLNSIDITCILQHLITAVGAAVCRHGHIFKMINLPTGEKHVYAIYLLKCLVDSGVVPSFWWYDINCK